MIIFGRDTTILKSGIWECKKNLNIEKITFKVVQMNISNAYYFYAIKNYVYLQ